MVLSMMYASDRPILTGCFSSLMFSMAIGTSLYANVMSPVLYKVTLKVNNGDFDGVPSWSGTFSHITVNAVPENKVTVNRAVVVIVCVPHRQ